MAPTPFGVARPSPVEPAPLTSLYAQSTAQHDATWTPWRQFDEPRLQGVALRLLNIIQEHPGVHFRGLGRAAGLTSAGQLRHHVDRLVRCGAIAEVKDGRFSRYFANGEHDARNRDHLARLARPLPMQIAALLLSRPMTRTELRRRLGCADSTLGYHLNRMVRCGDLDRRPARGPYALADPVNARHLVAYLQGPRNDRPERPPATRPVHPIAQPGAAPGPADPAPTSSSAPAATSVTAALPPLTVPAPAPAAPHDQRRSLIP